MRRNWQAPVANYVSLTYTMLPTPPLESSQEGRGKEGSGCSVGSGVCDAARIPADGRRPHRQLGRRQLGGSRAHELRQDGDLHSGHQADAAARPSRKGFGARPHHRPCRAAVQRFREGGLWQILYLTVVLLRRRRVLLRRMLRLAGRFFFRPEAPRGLVLRRPSAQAGQMARGAWPAVGPRAGERQLQEPASVGRCSA